MKKLMIIGVAVLLLLTACDMDNDDDSDVINSTLTIKNQSFSDLLDVQWQGVTFRSNTIENAIHIGNTVTKKIRSGSGYIFFKRKSNPAFARTRDVVTLGENGAEKFVFIDNTLIVEANNPDNTGTLKDMTTTVVFYDDAEGAIQQYAERISALYSTYNRYKGEKSIILGGYPARLKLILDLDRKADLSFWFETITNLGSITSTLSIDGTKKAEWKGKYNWSYQKYPLEAGAREIEWTISAVSGTNIYLCLDNILVVYTE